MHKVLWDG